MKKSKNVSIWWFLVVAFLFLFFVVNKIVNYLMQHVVLFISGLLFIQDSLMSSVGWGMDIFTALVLLDFILLALSFYTGKKLFLFPHLQTKLLYFLLKPITMVTSPFWIGEKIILSFFTLTNKLVPMFPKNTDEARMPLLLLPRCLQDSECNKKVILDVNNCEKCGKCDLAPLVALKDKYQIEVFVAGGGGEAKRKIIQSHPSVVVAVACVEELILNSSAVLKYPVVAFSNETGDVPCKNTKADVEVIEEYVAKIAHKRV